MYLLLMTGAAALLLSPLPALAQQEQQRDTTRVDPPGHPLIAAARSGDAEEVERLLAAGTDPDVRPVHGLTPLMWAATLGDVRMARALV